MFRLTWPKLAIRIALVAVLSIGLSIGVTPVRARPAAAVEPATVAAAASAAYTAYKEFLSGALTLDQATDRIVGSITAARVAIIGHLDQLAAADVRGCARSAVIDVSDIELLTPDTLQAFARDATLCAARAEATIGVAGGAGLDELGFALNVVGPIALLARARAGFSAELLRATIDNGNRTLISRLRPSCKATPLWGDASPRGSVEVLLRCTAYNGHQGFDSVVYPRPLPSTYDFTVAIGSAMVGTSYPVAQAALLW